MRLAPALVAAGLLRAVSAHAESKDLIPLAHGTYVREDFDATNPPFAALLAYGGSSFSGPHPGVCVSKVLDHEGVKYRVSTTCFAEGDGTPAARYAEKKRIVAQSATRMRFARGDGTAV